MGTSISFCVDPPLDETDLEKEEEENNISIAIACCRGTVKQPQNGKANEKTDITTRGNVLQSSQSG